MTGDHDTRIDEELYSRQLYVLGHDAMQKMMKYKVLVVGLDGLGQEVTKNICLAGIRSVLLYDKTPVSQRDLCAGFYLENRDIGKPRDQSVLKKISSLNRYVKVGVVDSVDLSQCSLVVSINQSISYNLKLSEECRIKSVKFVMANVEGVFSQVFVDLGEHVCVDKNGAHPSIGTINDISSDGILTIADGSKHTLATGDSVRIGKAIYKVTVLSRTEFRLENYKETDISGIRDFEQVKVPFTIVFKSLKESISAPEILSFGNDNRARILHDLFVGNNAPVTEEASNSLSEAEQEVETGRPSPKKICLQTENIHLNDTERQQTEKYFNGMKDCLITPMCSIIGGIVAQEIIKAASGKFIPLKQFFYFEYPELCFNILEPSVKDRYFNLRKIIGDAGVERIKKLNVFLVGAGAIGCEHLKNFVMSGIGLDGHIAVTDMDSIEHSNLNRQFLFKEEDVSSLKSEAAVRQAAILNEDYSSKNGRLVSYNLAVSPSSENIFSDTFLRSIDVIANALDNVEARNYMDTRAVMLRRPMFDSGTLGTKGHVQVVIPFATESYSSTVDAAESSIPACTVKSYPSTIEHAIEWALEEFRTKFNSEVESVKGALDGSDPESKPLLEEAPRTVEGCIKSALAYFVHLFSTDIQNLLSTFPADSLTKEGFPFWSPPKRPPSPISFNVNDKLHLLFVESCSNLFASCYSIRRIGKSEINAYLENVLSLCEPNPIHFGDTPVDLSVLNPLEYDKDSWHVDFIYSCSNLRARNYKIKEQSKHFIRGVSGKIIPAIATTTAVVSGLCTMEMIKYALVKAELIQETNKEPLGFDAVKNAFLDLGLPLLMLTDFVPPREHSYEVRGEAKKYNLWSRIELEDAPLEVLIEKLNAYLEKTISMASIGSKIVYWNFSSKYNDNLSKSVAELCNRKAGQLIQYVDFLEEDEMEFESVAVIFNE
ncbi:ubiquitin-activating enzyme E1 [Pancytospora epiphaga]|nr:ubiquitin-activating enzyme E1 [Pancytospora epiphaga]